jgi:hypothetical protein
VGPGYRRPISSASSRSSIESTRRTASEREQVSGKQLRKELGQLESFGFDVDLIGFDLDQLKTTLAALGTSGRTDSANFRLDVWNGPRTGFPSTTLLSTAERLGVVATGAAKPHRPERWRIGDQCRTEPKRAPGCRTCSALAELLFLHVQAFQLAVWCFPTYLTAILASAAP